MSAEWVMVIITGVYVIATIFICWANIKSARASKEQLIEMQKQHAESNRPNIEAEFHYVNRTWYVVRFINHGQKTAQHVKINIEKSFLSSLTEESFRNTLEKIHEKECIIGVGQHYDLFIGSNKLRERSNKEPFTGTIDYEALGLTYSADLFIDLEHYMSFFFSTTYEEEMCNSMKTIANDLTSIRSSLIAK